MNAKEQLNYIVIPFGLLDTCCLLMWFGLYLFSGFEIITLNNEPVVTGFGAFSFIWGIAIVGFCIVLDSLHVTEQDKKRERDEDTKKIVKEIIEECITGGLYPGKGGKRGDNIQEGKQKRP